MHVFCTDTVVFTHLTELNHLIKQLDKRCYQPELSGGFIARQRKLSSRSTLEILPILHNGH